MNESMTATDNDLLARASKGDKQAFGILYQRYMDEIYRYILYKVDIPTTAEDLTEDTFLNTWEYLPKIAKNDGNIKNFRAWLYRTARNLVIDFYRKKKPLNIFEKLIPATRLSPEKIAQRNSQSKRLTKAIKLLDDAHQQIIILRFINEFSHREIASIMDISETYSRVLQYRALKKLAIILAGKEGSNEE